MLVFFSVFLRHDRWCNEAPLIELLLALYVLGVDRNVSVIDYREQMLGIDVWPPSFV